MAAGAAPSRGMERADAGAQSFRRHVTPSQAPLPKRLPYVEIESPPRVAERSRLHAVLGVLGGAFVAIGMFDVLLAWYPSAFGSPEWEFGTVLTTLNGMPVPALGFGLLTAYVSDSRAAWPRLVLRAVLVVLALLLVLAALLWATTLPFAFRPVDNDVVRMGLYKAVAKAVVQAIGYPVLFLVLAVLCGRGRAT